MWGIIPAAGIGARLQPLAFSKELLPVGSRLENIQRPKAVSEYLIERMLAAGVDKLCFVISPDKTDIVKYYGARLDGVHVSYTVQPKPVGLCDAIFRAMRTVGERGDVLVGLPDTIWFPVDGFCSLKTGVLGFLLFPVREPQWFDAVETFRDGGLKRFAVKQENPPSNWVWGAFRAPIKIMSQLHGLWRLRECRDVYVGDLVNAYLAAGGHCELSFQGTAYVDVGTFDGYREAVALLAEVGGTTGPPTTTTPITNSAGA